MAVSKTQYTAVTKQYTTLEGTLAEVMTQLQTDGISLNRCIFVYDSTSKCVCIYQ